MQIEGNAKFGKEMKEKKRFQKMLAEECMSVCYFLVRFRQKKVKIVFSLI